MLVIAAVVNAQPKLTKDQREELRNRSFACYDGECAPQTQKMEKCFTKLSTEDFEELKERTIGTFDGCRSSYDGEGGLLACIWETVLASYDNEDKVKKVILSCKTEYLEASKCLVECVQKPAPV